MQTVRLRHKRRPRLLLVLGLLSLLAIVAANGCGYVNTDTTTAPAAENHSGIVHTTYITDNGPHTDDCSPREPAPVFTEKLAWIVMSLVVLGWLVLAADFPPET